MSSLEKSKYVHNVFFTRSLYTFIGSGSDSSLWALKCDSCWHFSLISTFIFTFFFFFPSSSLTSHDSHELVSPSFFPLFTFFQHDLMFIVRRYSVFLISKEYFYLKSFWLTPLCSIQKIYWLMTMIVCF